jgi:hypothetical protein
MNGEPLDLDDEDGHVPSDLVDLYLDLEALGLDPHTWEPLSE